MTLTKQRFHSNRIRTQTELEHEENSTEGELAEDLPLGESISEPLLLSKHMHPKRQAFPKFSEINLGTTFLNPDKFNL